MMPNTREELLDAFGLAEPEKRRGSGRILPKEFIVPDVMQTNKRGHGGLPHTDQALPLGPEDIFISRPGLTNGFMERLSHRLDPTKVLLLTDGACTDNGQPGARAGWAFQFGPEPEMRVASGRLENTGPFGHPSRQTSNRAELRAVLAALRCRPWSEDGYKTIVIATDSEYVVKGATTWIRSWIENGWKSAEGSEVQNKDLWELLMGEFERYHETGLVIEFWRIRRELNTVADSAARQACADEDWGAFGDYMVPGI
ncbi:putative RNase H type-1 domain-containing protein [Seiridium cardinale]|uniref:ribonuclease H n=1 Tax=Seiridium cardinale TaxID=138064 RepID=A0ABR2XCW7_9PEZI